MISPSRRKHVHFDSSPPRSDTTPPSDTLSGSGLTNPVSITSFDPVTSSAEILEVSAPLLPFRKPQQRQQNRPRRSLFFCPAQSHQSIISSSLTFPVTHRCINPLSMDDDPLYLGTTSPGSKSRLHFQVSIVLVPLIFFYTSEKILLSH